MTENNLSVRHYNRRYFLALVLLTGAAILLAMQAVYQWQIGVLDCNPLRLLFAASLATVVCVLPYRSGLILRQACRKDSYCFIVFLVPALTIIFLLIAERGFDVTSLWTDLRHTLSDASAEFERTTDGNRGAETSWNPFDLLVPIWHFLRGVIFSFFWLFIGVIWRMMQFLLLVSLLISSAFVLILSRILKIRSGIALYYALLLVFVCLWAVQASESYTGYTGIAILLLLPSIALVTNWGAIQVNRPIWQYHPTCYDLVCDLAATKAKRLSRDEVRESIWRHLEGVDLVDRDGLRDRIEERLYKDQLLLPLPEGGYRPAYRKRLGILHLVAVSGATIYLLNGGFGIIEVIPDFIPVIGNLDEGGIAALVTWWIYKLYLEDKSEEEGLPSVLASAVPFTIPPEHHSLRTETLPHQTELQNTELIARKEVETDI